MAVQAVLVQVAEAVTAELNTANLSQSFDAVRSYADWAEKLEDFDELHVDVVPTQRGYLTTEEVTHEDITHTLEIDIGVRKRFVQADLTSSIDPLEVRRIWQSEIDKLVLLLEEIAEYFAIDRFATYDDARWTDTQIQTAYSKKLLREFGQYFGFVRLTFAVTKAVR